MSIINLEHYINILTNIQSGININNGTLNEEYIEQLLSIIIIEPTDTVLELGGNIGRNSCVISKILNNSENLLVIEPGEEIYNQLKENRDLNNFNFKIENTAISKTYLIHKGWTTKSVEDINNIEDEWKLINTISWTDLQNKYNMNFNVLVVDCEGALYYILKEEPEFLKNFNKIIIENDFLDINHYNFIENEFKRYNFINVLSIPLPYNPIYPDFPTKDFFYQAWIKQ